MLQVSTILQPFTVYANDEIDNFEEIRYTDAGKSLFRQVTRVACSRADVSPEDLL